MPYWKAGRDGAPPRTMVSLQVGDTMTNPALRDHGREQREVQRIGPEIPTRLEAYTFVNLTNAPALLDVALVQAGTGEAHQVSALRDHQALLGGGIPQQIARGCEGEQVAIEGSDEGVGVLLEDRLELREQRDLFRADIEEGEALLQRPVLAHVWRSLPRGRSGTLGGHRTRGSGARGGNDTQFATGRPPPPPPKTAARAPGTSPPEYPPLAHELQYSTS